MTKNWNTNFPKCKEDKDCSADFCTYCNKGTCNVIDTDIFFPKLPCSYSLYHCYKGYCNEEKKVIAYEGYGECICYCSQERVYGKRCLYTYPKADDLNSFYPSGIQFVTPVHVEFNKASNMLIIVSSGEPYPVLLIQDTIGGFAARAHKPTVENSEWTLRNCYDFMEKEKYLYREICNFLDLRFAKTVYIINFVIPFDFTTPPTEKIKSFTRQLRLDAFHPYFPEIKLSTHSHHYHIHYPESYNFRNIPIIRLANCGKNLESVTVYRFQDSIHITVEFLYLSQLYYDLYSAYGIDYEWIIWTIQKFEGETTQNWETNKVLDFQFKLLWYDVEPFSWLGTYMINLTVYGMGPGQKRQEEFDNFNICLLRVELSPLVAKISGGSSRSVFKEYGLTLDVSNSINPNTPDGKSDMYFEITCNWTQDSICKPYITESKSYEPLTIKRFKLQSKKAYNFTLKVMGKNKYKSLGPSFASQIVNVESVGNKDPSIKQLTLDCIYNCKIKTNPKDIVCLRVGGNWTSLESITFDWLVFEADKYGSRTNEISIDSIRQKNTLSFTLIINEDSLKENAMYEFLVGYKNFSQYASYTITTTFSSLLKCEIDPSKGKVGLTNFKLSCTSDFAKTFEFYDKYKADESDFSGRMITSQETGQIEDFVLTRGKLEIVSYDAYGMTTRYTINVELTGNNSTSKDVKKTLINMIKLSGVESVTESLKKASVISDLLTSAINNGETSGIGKREILLKLLSTLAIKRYEDAKLGISTLHLTLLAARGSLSLNSVWYAAQTIQTLAKALAVGLNDGNKCTFRLLYQIVSRILDCLYIVLEVEETFLGNETISLRHNDPEAYSRIKEISKSIVKSSFFLKLVLSHRHLPLQKQKLIESSLGNLSIWIKVDIPTALSKFTQEEYLSKMFPVIIPNDLAEDVTKMGFYLSLQFVSFKLDPIWLVKTNLHTTLDVSVCYKENNGQTCKYPKTLKYGIKVVFDISNFILQIQFSSVALRRLDEKLESDLLDMELPVYKLDPLPQADVEAFFQFYDNNTELFVLVKKDFRPTYKMLSEENTTITTEHLMYPVVANPSLDPHLYYMAIQPGGHIKINDTITFDFKIYSKMCYTWHNRWETKSCKPITPIKSNILICECKKLSLIGGLVKEVVYYQDVVEEFPLYLTFMDDNLANVMCIPLPLALLTFILLLLICRKADLYDRTKRFVSILPDNLPGDEYGYLVCVTTGARIGAGTDAAVGIKIYGTINEGRSHILSSKTHNVMERMGEDWFLIFETETLGKITYLDLWHDSSGARADWFCDSIIVYDLHHRDCYFFVVSDWISLSLKRFPQTTLFPAPLSEITSPPRVFLDYFKLGFHLSHVWLDTIIRHPRDPVTRVDRLAIILCFILVSMAFSVLLIVLSDNYLEVDDFSYSVTWLVVELSVYTSIFATTIACILMHMFRNIYKIVYFVKKEEGIISQKRNVTRLSITEDYISSPSIASISDDINHIHYGRRHKLPHQKHPNRTLEETLNLALMPKPLVPVQIKGDDPNVIVRKLWLIITWVIVIALIMYCTGQSFWLASKLPPVKAMKWLTIVGFSIIIHAIIILPIKITFVAVILAVAFKRIIYKDVYTFDPPDGQQLEHYGVIKYLANLVYLRSQPMYKPLHEVFHEEHRQKMLKERQWRMLFELLIQIVFLVVLCMLLKVQIPIQYQSNAHLHTLFKNFYNLYNTTDLKFFEQDCETCFFKYIWYNGNILAQGSEQNFFRKDWMFDIVNRLIGKVYLRQFRVQPGYCEASINLTIDCAAPFSKRTEDTKDYLPFWVQEKSISKADELLGIQWLGKWSYHWPIEETDFLYDIASGQTYPRGGYTWDLRASVEEMDASLIKLWEQGFIGHYTRLVLAQAKVYNVNTQLFSEVLLVAEQSIAGQIIPTTIVQSVNTSIQFGWWLIIFAFFTFMLCVRIFRLINFVGILDFFTNWRRPCELLMTVNALTVLLYMFLHFFTVPQYVTEYQSHSSELKFFSFYKISHYSFIARTLLCGLFVLNLIRFYSLWRFGKTLFRTFSTVKLSTNYVVWLIMIFVLFQLLLFRFVGYLLPIFLDVAFNPNLFYSCNCSHFSFCDKMFVFKMFCYIMSFNRVILMILFVSIYVYQYKTTRDESIWHWSIYNYFTFVHNEVTAMTKKPIVQRTTIIVKSVIGMQDEKKNTLRKYRYHRM